MEHEVVVNSNRIPEEYQEEYEALKARCDMTEEEFCSRLEILCVIQVVERFSDMWKIYKDYYPIDGSKLGNLELAKDRNSLQEYVNPLSKFYENIENEEEFQQRIKESAVFVEYVEKYRCEGQVVVWCNDEQPSVFLAVPPQISEDSEEYL